jgi:hypothetical protein
MFFTFAGICMDFPSGEAPGSGGESRKHCHSSTIDLVGYGEI